MAERPNGGRGGSVENRFPNVQKPVQRPADVSKGATNECKPGEAKAPTK